MNGTEIMKDVYGRYTQTDEIVSDMTLFAEYIDKVLGKTLEVKAAGASEFDATLAVEKVFRAFVYKTWGGGEKTYAVDGKLVTIGASVTNYIVEKMKFEVSKAYQ